MFDVVVDNEFGGGNKVGGKRGRLGGDYGFFNVKC